MQLEVFVSHSSKDENVARALVDLMRAAFAMSARSIRCTSVDGCKLGTGASTDEQLRKELLGVPVFVGLITPASILSAYVLFELGARWGAHKSFFPLLASGAKTSSLVGPIRGTNARNCYSVEEIHQFLEDAARELNRRIEPVAAFQRHIDDLLNKARDITEPPTLPTGLPLPGSHSEDIDFGSPLKIGPRELCDNIRYCLPLKRAAKAAEFVGHSIEWNVSYDSASGRADGLVDLTLHPLDPEGYEILIWGSVRLAQYPQLASLQSKSPLRICAKITKASEHQIELQDVALNFLQPVEAIGTPIDWLIKRVRYDLGEDLSKVIQGREIVTAITHQVELGNPPGLTIHNGKLIRPELSLGSRDFKLLLLHVSKHLLETTSATGTKQRRDRLLSLENAIYHLQNDQFHSF